MAEETGRISMEATNEGENFSFHVNCEIFQINLLSQALFYVFYILARICFFMLKWIKLSFIKRTERQSTFFPRIRSVSCISARVQRNRELTNN